MGDAVTDEQAARVIALLERLVELEERRRGPRPQGASQVDRARAEAALRRFGLIEGSNGTTSTTGARHRKR
jgi:hypothetical protein